MSRLVSTFGVWSTVVLLGASCATQPGTNGAATEAVVDARNFNGIWQSAADDLTEHLLPGEEIVLTPHGAEQYRAVDHSKFPGNTCMPYGPNRGMAATNPYMIVQTPEVIAVVTEHIDYRIFYMNAEHPADIMDYPEWMGHSTGRWEGDTLIVDTVGTRPESWLDRGGLQHSAQMHLVERFQKTGPDAFTWTVTVEDPVFYTKPWTYQLNVERLDFPRLLPARCADNEVDTQHMLPLPGAIHTNPPTLPKN